MEFVGNDPSALVICPFDANHLVSRRKFQYHISKCIKTYSGSKVACPYNASEFIEPWNLMQHLNNCPSQWARVSHKFSLQQGTLITTDYAGKQTIEPPFFHPDIPEPTESWGLEF